MRKSIASSGIREMKSTRRMMREHVRVASLFLQKSLPKHLMLLLSNWYWNSFFAVVVVASEFATETRGIILVSSNIRTADQLSIIGKFAVTLPRVV